MAGNEIGPIIISLKQDVKTVQSLGQPERENHLNEISKPLLHSTFLILGRQLDKLEDSQYLQLCDYLLNYLTYSQFIAVESTMCLYRLMQLHDDFDPRLKEKVDNLIDLQDSRADRYAIFRIVSHLFTFNSSLGSDIFTKMPSFVSLVTNETTLLANQLGTINTETIKLLETLLILLSNACVDEPSRSMIASMYISLLIKCITLTSDERTLQSKCYAATILIKVWRMVSTETIENNAESLRLNTILSIILDCLDHGLHTSVEGLSLLCTNFQVKELVRNEIVVKKLFELLSDNKHTRYGIISTLSLMVLPRRTQEMQQKSVMRLKDSNSISNVDIVTNGKINSADVKYNSEQVKFVIQAVIDQQVISKHVAPIFKSVEASKGLMGECIRLIYHVLFPDTDVIDEGSIDSDSKFKELFIEEAKQSIKLLTAYLIGTSQNLKYNHKSFVHLLDESIELSEQELESRALAIEALSSPLISSNVNAIYGGEDQEAALSPVPFLLEILVQHDIDVGTSMEEKYTPFKTLKKQVFSNFDVYYAIVSLAALCSLPLDQVKQSVFTLGFDSIMNSINTNDDKLQLAALQLLSEICLIPLCVARLFNWENEEHDYYKNFVILSHLLLSTNTDSQCFVLQIFANVSGFGIVAEKLAGSELFCKNLNQIYLKQSAEENLVYYALCVLFNLCQVENSTSKSYLSIFKESKNEISKLAQSTNEQISDCSRVIISYL